MKIQHLLLSGLLLISQTLLSQDVTLTGTVLCPDGTQFNSNGINYIFMTQDSSNCCVDSVGIPLDANGNFNYIYTGETQGIVTLWYADYSGNYVGASAYYYPGNTELTFVLNACEPEEEPCWIDISYGMDSLYNEEAYVFLMSGTNVESPQYTWTFGDGGTSTEANPVYEYEETGSYTICVTVTGGGCTASDCIDITVDENGDGQEGGGMIVQGFTLIVNGGLSSTEEIPTSGIAVYPNPLIGSETIQINTPQAIRGEVNLFTASGLLVEKFNLNTGNGTSALPINTTNLPGGIYILCIKDQNGKTHQFKLIH